jgi:hypothetical protein
MIKRFSDIRHRNKIQVASKFWQVLLIQLDAISTRESQLPLEKEEKGKVSVSQDSLREKKKDKSGNIIERYMWA